MLIFTEQRLNRVFKKIKNKRTIVITEKNRVNKKIRRILIKKERMKFKRKRVKIKSLKYIIIILFFFLFFFN